ncbi:hypothetical protein CPB86DRAFT_872584 [Serendipita vermifera]|nr:hypothetical protein CPB86DRAFT_872584 [Serendipita vermifera]
MHHNAHRDVQVANGTNPEELIMCVYPMSGQYGRLTRVMLYLLLVSAPLAQNYFWLIAGLLAYVMTYTATTAFHAVVLAFAPKRNVDLDAFATLTVLSCAILGSTPMAWWSSTLGSTEFRAIFRVWRIVLIIGLVCALATRASTYQEEAACRSSHGELLTSRYQLLDPSFQCTYSCFSHHQILKDQDELVAIKTPQGLFNTNQASLSGFAPLFSCAACLFIFIYGLFPLCWHMRRKRTERELEASIQSHKARLERLGKSRNKKSIQRRAYSNSRIWEAEHELKTGKVPKPAETSVLIVALVPFVAILSANEIGVLRRLPEADHEYAVGQWSSWIGVALGAIAATINRTYEPVWKERQTILDEERTAFLLCQREPETTPPVLPELTFQFDSTRGEGVTSNSTYESPVAINEIAAPPPVHSHPKKEATI